LNGIVAGLKLALQSDSYQEVSNLHSDLVWDTRGEESLPKYQEQQDALSKHLVKKKSRRPFIKTSGLNSEPPLKKTKGITILSGFECGDNSSAASGPLTIIPPCTNGDLSLEVSAYPLVSLMSAGEQIVGLPVESPSDTFEFFLEKLEREICVESSSTVESWFLIPLKFVHNWQESFCLANPEVKDSFTFSEIEAVAITDIKKTLMFEGHTAAAGAYIVGGLLSIYCLKGSNHPEPSVTKVTRFSAKFQEACQRVGLRTTQAWLRYKFYILAKEWPLLLRWSYFSLNLFEKYHVCLAKYFQGIALLGKTSMWSHSKNLLVPPLVENPKSDFSRTGLKNG